METVMLKDCEIVQSLNNSECMEMDFGHFSK